MVFGGGKTEATLEILNIPESTAGILLFPMRLLKVRLLAMSVCTPAVQRLLPFTDPWEAIPSLLS